MIQNSKAPVIPISLKKDNLAGESADELVWKTALQNIFTKASDLFDFLQIENTQLLDAAERANTLFPFRVTKSYAAKIAKNDLNDPLLKQILPIQNEFTQADNFSADPTGDQQAKKTTGLLHKYHGRALIILTSACAIHCRYCFRREHPYSDNKATRSEWDNIVKYLESDTSIKEVILSGGDPLLLSNEKLSEFLNLLEKIPHIKRLRIHTRLPVVLPERITPALCNLLEQQRFQIITVIHCNHANELDDEIAKGISLLKTANIAVLNQAVLLAGVNDDAETLCQLSETLFSIGVLPYYLHLFDKVNGATHFDTSEEKALVIYSEMMATLPGYLLPKLVKDLPEQSSKTLLV